MLRRIMPPFLSWMMSMLAPRIVMEGAIPAEICRGALMVSWLPGRCGVGFACMKSTMHEKQCLCYVCEGHVDPMCA